MVTNLNQSVLDEKTDEIKRLTNIIIQHEQRWNKICAILQVNTDDAPRVLKTLRLMKANIAADEDVIAPELIEARKAFPALNDLHAKIDDALVYEWQRLNSNLVMPIPDRVRYEPPASNVANFFARLRTRFARLA
jgi:hypothetical protein